MNRRKFLSQCTRASLAAYWLRLGLSPVSAAIPLTSARSDALGPVRDYLGSYIEPTRSLDISRSQRMTYDIVAWSVGGGRSRTNTRAGQLQIKREPREGTVRYHIDQRMDGNRWVSEVVCTGGELGTPRHWQTEFSRGHSDPRLARLMVGQETASVEGKVIRLRCGGRTREVPFENRLVCSWTMLDAGSVFPALAEENQPIDYLYEMSSLRPAQRIRRDPAFGAEADSKFGAAAYLMTGEGSLPTHYVIGAKGQVLFQTVLLTSFALVKVENLPS